MDFTKLSQHIADASTEVAPSPRLTTSQMAKARRPYRVTFRNAINGNTMTLRRMTKMQALHLANDLDQHPYNNTAWRVTLDDGVNPETVVDSSLWAE